MSATSTAHRLPMNNGGASPTLPPDDNHLPVVVSTDSAILDAGAIVARRLSATTVIDLSAG